MKNVLKSKQGDFNTTMNPTMYDDKKTKKAS